jgi:hypothetical protein
VGVKQLINQTLPLLSTPPCSVPARDGDDNVNLLLNPRQAAPTARYRKLTPLDSRLSTAILLTAFITAPGSLGNQKEKYTQALYDSLSSFPYTVVPNDCNPFTKKTSKK